MGNGWNESAQAWIENSGQHGDKSRRFILDPVMVERLAARQYRRDALLSLGAARDWHLGTEIVLLLLMVREPREFGPAGIV